MAEKNLTTGDGFRFGFGSTLGITAGLLIISIPAAVVGYVINKRGEEKDERQREENARIREERAQWERERETGSCSGR